MHNHGLEHTRLSSLTRMGLRYAPVRPSSSADTSCSLLQPQSGLRLCTIEVLQTRDLKTDHPTERCPKPYTLNPKNLNPKTLKP